MPLKCQMCDKAATFHITELTGGKPQELHLCEEHARKYLTQADGPEGGPPSLAGALAQQLVVGQAAQDLARLDQRSCPVCGITFYEFRNSGRLGCPHDYACFRKELEPLIANVHGEAEHKGKRPKRSQGDTSQQVELIRLRREMKEAIDEEQYERASDIRDQIRKLESSGESG